MPDSGTQVAIGTKRRLKSTSSQTPEVSKKDVWTQIGGRSEGSYGRSKYGGKWKYDDLLARLQGIENTTAWLMRDGMLVKNQVCERCGSEMNMVKCNDRSDGWKWECKRQVDGKRHKVEKSIRTGSWFQESNMTLEEIMKFTYWWSRGLDQSDVQYELGLSSNTAVDWGSFCREICEVTLLENSDRLGGEGKTVQIDESKFGKRKYHRGHHVEGQWVFGGIESDSRRCFLVAVEKRDEETLLPIIQQWIKPGTTIISDCWKAYCNLEKHGYTHRTVNHSKEFVNDGGDHTNKIEGHWRQAKATLPPFGVRKHHFSSYLAEFMWRYKHKGEDLFQCFLNDTKRVYNL